MSETEAKIAEVLISEDRLRARVAELGKQITRDYAGKNIFLVGILKGSAIFLADLIRKIELDVDYDFVAISSYGDNEHSSGVVRVIKDIDGSVEGRDVLIVEDIVDTGWTLRMSYLVENLIARGASDVKICALLDKPSRRRVNIDIDYCGFTVEDHFVVGYGLDYKGCYRNLPFIGIVKSGDLIIKT